MVIVLSNEKETGYSGLKLRRRDPEGVEAEGYILRPNLTSERRESTKGRLESERGASPVLFLYRIGERRS